jgi:hypothetical protein
MIGKRFHLFVNLQLPASLTGQQHQKNNNPVFQAVIFYKDTGSRVLQKEYGQLKEH